jgi:hypothetical protein
MSVLKFAAAKGHVDVATFLVASGANVNAADDRG